MTSIKANSLTFVPLIDTTRNFIPSSIGDAVVAWFSLPSSSKVIVLDHATSCTRILIARPQRLGSVGTTVTAHHFDRCDVVPAHNQLVKH